MLQVGTELKPKNIGGLSSIVAAEGDFRYPEKTLYTIYGTARKYTEDELRNYYDIIPVTPGVLVNNPETRIFAFRISGTVMYAKYVKADNGSWFMSWHRSPTCLEEKDWRLSSGNLDWWKDAIVVMEQLKAGVR